MLDFEKELSKLLSAESDPLETDELGLVVKEGKSLLGAIDRKQADISLQIEEIYDIVQDGAVQKEALRMEQARVKHLLSAVVGLSDMIEDFCAFAAGSGSEELASQGRMMWKNVGNLLETCAVTRTGERGQILDPSLHAVQAARASAFPRECVAEVLRSGYRYMGNVIRKATVIISTGVEEINDE